MIKKKAASRTRLRLEADLLLFAGDSEATESGTL